MWCDDLVQLPCSSSAGEEAKCDACDAPNGCQALCVKNASGGGSCTAWSYNHQHKLCFLKGLADFPANATYQTSTGKPTASADTSGRLWKSDDSEAPPPLPLRARQRQLNHVPVVPHGGDACATEFDCALGGNCTAGRCACDPWFTGGNCTLLNLQRARPGNGFDLTGLKTGSDTFHGSHWRGWSSWGGHAVFDSTNNSHPWVGVFSLMARGCGLHAYHSNSESVVATAQQVDGPYVLQEPDNPDSPANIAVPAPSHCTQLKRHPSGQYHLWHIFPGGADNASSPDHGPPELTCANGSASTTASGSGRRPGRIGWPGPPPPPPHPCPATGCIPAVNQQLFVHTAPSPRGPWSVPSSEEEVPVAVLLNRLD